jgi:hypothetical protein
MEPGAEFLVGVLSFRPNSGFGDEVHVRVRH